LEGAKVKNYVIIKPVDFQHGCQIILKLSIGGTGYTYENRSIYLGTIPLCNGPDELNCFISEFELNCTVSKFNDITE